MAKRKFIDVTTGNYSILHGYDTDNKEIREFIQVNENTNKLLATSTIVSVDEQYIVTSPIKGKLFFWEYKNSFQDIKSELQKQPSLSY